MKNFFFAFLLIVFVSVFVYSCKKNTGPSEPVITLTSPTDTIIINSGDTVLIKGTVSDNKSLHEVYITFKEVANDSVLLINDHPYTHGAKNYNLNYIWYTSVPAVYKLTIEVHDHDENIIRKDFLMTVH